MTRNCLIPLSAFLGLMLADTASAQAVLNGAPPSSQAVQPATDIFANSRLAGLRGGTWRLAGFGGRANPVAGLALNSPMTRSDVQGPGGFRLEAVGGTPYGAGAQLWSNSGWSRMETDRRAPTKLKLAASWSRAFGVDTGLSGASLGAAVGYTTYQDDVGGGFNIDARGWSGSLNAGYTAPSGLYVQGSAGYAPNIKLNRMRRPGYFGPTSAGVRRARAAGASLQMGAVKPLAAGWEGGPFVSVDLLNVDMGAHIGRAGALVAARSFGRTRTSFGVQGFSHWGGLSPSLQFAYVHVDPLGAQSAMTAMAAMRYSAGARGIDSRWRDHFLAGAALDGRAAGFTWRAQFEGRVADETRRADLRTGVVMSKLF
jgi:hypothetical protein